MKNVKYILLLLTVVNSNVFAQTIQIDNPDVLIGIYVNRNINTGKIFKLFNISRENDTWLFEDSRYNEETGNWVWQSVSSHVRPFDNTAIEKAFPRKYLSKYDGFACIGNEAAAICRLTKTKPERERYVLLSMKGGRTFFAINIHPASKDDIEAFVQQKPGDAYSQEALGERGKTPPETYSSKDKIEDVVTFLQNKLNIEVTEEDPDYTIKQTFTRNEACNFTLELENVGMEEINEELGSVYGKSRETNFFDARDLDVSSIREDKDGFKGNITINSSKPKVIKRFLEYYEPGKKRYCTLGDNEYFRSLKHITDKKCVLESDLDEIYIYYYKNENSQQAIMKAFKNLIQLCKDPEKR